MNYDIFIPVRLSSTRLLNKALKDIDGKPIIHYLIDRLKQAKKIRHIIVCTTTNASDDLLVKFLEKNNILFFRGDEQDILTRFLCAAKHFNTDFLVDVGADDIYTDPIYVDKVVDEFEKTEADFIDMIDFPIGIASVGIKTKALEKICKLKKTHNTETGYRLFFTKNKIINVHQLKPQSNIKFPKNLRLTLDYEEDLILAEKILKALGNNFHLNDLLNLFEQKPELLKITENLDKRYEEHFQENLTDTFIRDI